MRAFAVLWMVGEHTEALQLENNDHKDFSNLARPFKQTWQMVVFNWLTFPSIPNES